MGEFEVSTRGVLINNVFTIGGMYWIRKSDGRI